MSSNPVLAFLELGHRQFACDAHAGSRRIASGSPDALDDRLSLVTERDPSQADPKLEVALGSKAAGENSALLIIKKCSNRASNQSVAVRLS